MQVVEPVQPDPDECSGPDDLHKTYFDEDLRIWYECMFDPRRQVFTWSALPTNEEE